MNPQSTGLLEERRVRDFLAAARIAHLSTADATGAPHVVPLCFWFDGARFYFVVDEKPKRRASGAPIKRMRNIAENPRVAIVVDHYEDDWEHLAYVMVRGHASVIADGEEYMLALRGLRDKYPQYRAMTLAPERNPIVRIDPDRVNVWGARFVSGGEIR
jgi:PPOX class probable F420-dependent enzyme